MIKVVREVQIVNPGAELYKFESFIGELNGKRYEALKAKLEVLKDRRLVSFVCLAPIDDVYVKIRFSQPQGNDYESQVNGLVASLLTELKLEDPQAHKHKIAPALFVNPAETEHGKSYVVSGLLSYGAFMSMEIGKGKSLDTLERALNCWEPTLKILEAMKSKRSSDAIDDPFGGMIAWRNAGYFKEYLWVYFRRPYWIQPPGFRLDEFKVWASHDLKGHIPCDTNRVLVEWK